MRSWPLFWWLVFPLNISCGSCSRVWQIVSSFSIYEQQDAESSPCPHCGAYTLCCHEPARPGQRWRADRRRTERGPRLAVGRLVGGTL